MRRILFVIPVLLVPLLAWAAVPTWKVDAAKSTLGFSDTQTGTVFNGRFKSFAADIVFSPSDLPASHIDVTVDLASATTGDSQRDTALPGKDWFDVAKGPQAVFKSSAITSLGGSAYQVAGILTLRGIAQKVTLPFNLVLTGATAHATGKIELLRTTYGVGQGPWKSGDYVGLNVTVMVDITATSAAP